MKKTLGILLLLTLLCGFSVSAASAEALEPRTLVVAFPYINKAPEDIEMVEQALSALTQAKINATVDLMPISYGAWNEQFNLLMAGDEQVDLIASGLTNTSLSAKVGRGYFLELDTLLDTYGQGTRALLGGYLVGGKVDGVTYAVPTMRDLASASGMMFLQSYIDKYNIDLSGVKEWADFTEIFRILKEGEGESFYPLFLNASQYTSFMATFSDNLGDFLGTLTPGAEDNGQVINRFENAEYREFVELIRGWYDAGYINLDAAVTQLSWQEGVKGGNCACWPNNAKPGQDKNQANMVGQPMVLVPVGVNEVYTSSLQTAMWSIPYQTIDAERAMMLMELLYTDPDVFNTLCWGVEGVHYVFTEDGHITFPDGIDNTNCGWYINIGWLLGNQFLSYYWEGYDLDYWDVMSAFNDSAVISPAAGFVFDSSSVKNEYAACQAVINEYRIAIETGAVDTAKLDEMNAKLYASGLQAIIDAKQAQLDAFLANK